MPIPESDPSEEIQREDESQPVSDTAAQSEETVEEEGKLNEEQLEDSI